MPVNPMQFAPITPMQAKPNPGMALLAQVQKMQQGGGGAPQQPGQPGDMPPGFIQKMMQGNPGGLIGAIMNRNVSSTPSPSNELYTGDPTVPGFAPPAGGGGEQPGMMGMLAKMFGGMGGG